MSVEQLLAQCQAQGVELEVCDGALQVYFDEQPSSELLDALRRHKAEVLALLLAQGPLADGAPPPVAAPAGAPPPPPSFGQQRLWLLDQMDGGSEQYHLFNALAFTGRFDTALAQRVLAALIARHAPLRTAIRADGGSAYQHVLAADAAPFALLSQDIGALDEAARARCIADTMAAEAREPFDLAAGQMLRALCLHTGAGQGILMLTVHHIAADGWSINLLIGEFVQLYAALAAVQPDPLPALTLSYGDYARWQQAQLGGEALRRQADYWAGQLKGLAPVHGVPLDQPRGAREDFSGAQHGVTLGAGQLRAFKALAQAHGATLFMALHAAFTVLLARHAGERDIVIGTPVANRRRQEFEPLVGYFANTLVLRTEVDDALPFTAHLARIRDVNLAAQEHQDAPFELLVERVNPVRSQAHSPLFQIMLSLQPAAPAALALPGLSLRPLVPEALPAKFELTLHAAETDDGLALRFEYRRSLFEPATVARMARQLVSLIGQLIAQPQRPLRELDLLDAGERAQLLAALRAPAPAAPAEDSIQQAFERRAALTPDAVAIVCGERHISYGQLNAQANRQARHWRALGVGPESLVGVCMARSIEMVVALLSVLKAGGAYVPLDPAYPAARLAHMLADSDAALVLTLEAQRAGLAAHGGALVCLDQPRQVEAIGRHSADNLAPLPGARLAYVIYTSGSSGQPKGVMVEHGSVLAFLDAMGEVGGGQDAVWLGLTAVSFDISVLEMFGALLAGARLVLAPEQGLAGVRLPAPAPATAGGRAPDFSLFYFASTAPDGGDLYRLLLEGARFADQHGFTAVWTPERHFSAFGGVYPNPAVTGAAVAAVTSRIQIRAGSCVLPLNDPLKVAEDWSVIDNLSGGRAGLAFAAGWNPNDFALAPGHFARRHQVLEEGLESFRRFWRGEAVTRPNGVGQPVSLRLHPAPRQAMPPLWLTAAGGEQTFRRAGELGLNVLTHLLGQTSGELADKIALYRQAWRAAGHAGEGQVTLMLHTLVADSDAAALAVVERPFKDYLAGSLALMLQMRTELSGPGAAGAELDQEAVLEHAFQRYVKSAALIGSPQRCAALARELMALGVTEFACLIDFGVAPQLVLDSLPRLAALKDAMAAAARPAAATVGQLIARHGVTHVQCTPSYAAFLLADQAERAALRGLRALLVGGEACPLPLARQLTAATDGAVWNMYGPTEATVWASRQRLLPGLQEVAIGAALAHYGLHVVDPHLQLVPPGVPGELLITGAGLARGYWRQPGLTAERFIGFAPDGGAPVRAYRTGDRVRRLADGGLQFLGRIDAQVKLRGFRIEPGEIEAQLLLHPDVKSAACVARPLADGELALVAYVAAFAGMGASPKQLSAELRDMLELVLPEYMVPAAIMVLDALPVMANGKLDRQALPAPALAQGEARMAEYVAPATATERALAELWAALLRSDGARIGLKSNFFDLGGHSLLLMRLVSEIKARFEVDLSLREVFELSTLGRLAQRVDQRRAPADAGAVV
ncbi:MupA/Atu3671 family FMN-dependent luciferase-like monooxygenase [Duganella violaceipulchra]|uniref:LLM class flavin-dependent oxidoreductase n=1 Tax=Duganella violaceipulchra TaxID=2849652 RepID=A0AA41HJ90_9BURK|nr:MupA/Atu3671 family FMN-dependent luciferase-like monooxygenase [Duganella violaceicalia]MBV6325519.1 LLM class flavin-dependent oxidoreductase [Duganella violaceicalia]MCP2012692.1 natural product biosynthesis luciferase-like monooxygenase protein [Duganella violaceicalia]